MYFRHYVSCTAEKNVYTVHYNHTVYQKNHGKGTEVMKPMMLAHSKPPFLAPFSNNVVDGCLEFEQREMLVTSGKTPIHCSVKIVSEIHFSLCLKRIGEKMKLNEP